MRMKNENAPAPKPADTRKALTDERGLAVTDLRIVLMAAGVDKPRAQAVAEGFATRLLAASPAAQPALQDDEICHKDGAPCYVGKGTEDAHWRCGTGACGRKGTAPVPSSEQPHPDTRRLDALERKHVHIYAVSAEHGGCGVCQVSHPADGYLRERIDAMSADTRREG